MRVLVVEHQDEETVIGVLMDAGADRGRRRTFEGVVFYQCPLPYAAVIEDGLVSPIEADVTELGALRLGARGANTIGAGDHWIELAKLREDLTRRTAEGIKGRQGFLVAGELVVDCGEQSVDQAIDEQAQKIQRERAETDERVQQRQAAALQTAAREGQMDSAIFVNPYTFVPFPAECPPGFRTEPAGHARQGTDRVSGWFDLTLTAASPLMTSGPGVAGEGTKAKRFPRDAAGVPVITGSSLKGAVRSLHEVLAGGCLRVFDERFVPVYRELAHVLPASWNLVQVKELANGVPVLFEVAEQVVWTDIDEIHQAIPAARLRDGARVSIASTFPGRHNRTNGSQVSAGGDWVVHVTDVPNTRNDHPYYAACGKLAGSTAELRDLAVWDQFRRVVDGARDLQSGRPNIDVRHSPTKRVDDARAIGKRTAASRDLKVGDVLWADVSNGQVKQLKLSYLWRAEGGGAMGDRVPDWLHPCTSLDLCPSCRLFGSADDRGGGAVKGGRAEQSSYRGHVRFTDATLVAGELEEMDLAPMGAPRPGAGAFYLSTDGKRRADSRTDIPTARWGSREDTPLRQMRGRKFYWNADPAAQHPRRDRRGPAQGNVNMGGSAEVAPPGSQFTTRVCFTNLSLAELGALVACFRPSMALADDVPAGFSTEDPVLQLRLGGGKPLGYGAVDAEITTVCVQSAASRYLGAEAEQIDLQATVDAFRQWVPVSVRATWPDLAAVLRRDHVNPARVAYPPGANWPGPDDKEPAEFRSPFKFFKQVTGSDQCEENFPVLNQPPRSISPQLPIPGNKGKG